MATVGTSSAGEFSQWPHVPILENGDQLTRDEFERRYRLLPHLKKAELIEGVVYMPSPVRIGSHGTPQAAMICWLSVYWAFTPVVQVGDNSTVRMDLDNEPQPDGSLFIKPEFGGQIAISADDYVERAPELLAEISASTASLDLNAKFRVYRRNQVREYIVWRVAERAIDWFVLRGSRFERLPLDAAGCYRSEVFPGLWLPAQAMIDLDLATVLRVLQEGLATPEHAEFVARLTNSRTST